MKLIFEDKSYIEVIDSLVSEKVFISIGAKSHKNPLEFIINTVEISKEDLNKLFNGK